MTSFVWTIILSLMQGRFDGAREGASQQTEEQRRSAHYAAMQIHAGIPVSESLSMRQSHTTPMSRNARRSTVRCSVHMTPS